MVDANLDEIRSAEALRAWYVAHLREDHGFEAEARPPDEPPFAPISLADLKAAHDQVHAFLAELEAGRDRGTDSTNADAEVPPA